MTVRTACVTRPGESLRRRAGSGVPADRETLALPDDRTIRATTMSDVIQIQLHAPYLIFLADVVDHVYAKTGLGVAQWCRERCIGQLRLPGCAVDAGLPDMDVKTAAARGARSLILGVAPVGGGIQSTWVA